MQFADYNYKPKALPQLFYVNINFLKTAYVAKF